MKTVKIYQMDQLSHTQFKRLQTLQMEAAQVWNTYWEYGKDIDYLIHKAKQARISCFTGSKNEEPRVSVLAAGINISP